jgi:hypothetical protein
VPRPVHTQVSGHAELSVSDCHYPWLSASSGTQRARDLLIRRYPRGRPDPFRSVRDLDRVAVWSGGAGIYHDSRVTKRAIKIRN